MLTRRYRKWCCRLGLLPLVMFVFSTSQAAADGPKQSGRRPNIVYILADDLGYAELGCYGQKKIRTPNLDQMAAEGMRFTQHYCGAPVCAPSRCVLMTGMHLGHAYIRNNRRARLPDELKKQYGMEFMGQEPIPDAEVTIGEILKQKGYATAAIGHRARLRPPGRVSIVR